MPRRAAASIRPVEPDPVHRSKLVQQVINKVMLDGKKSTAERIVYDALAIIAERTGRDPVEYARAVDQGADAAARGPLPPRRRRDLPGARRGPGAPRPHPRRPLARRVRPPAPREVDGPAPRQRAAWTRSPSRAAPTSARTTSSAWRRPTRPSRTTAGSTVRGPDFAFGPPAAAAAVAQGGAPLRRCLSDRRFDAGRRAALAPAGAELTRPRPEIAVVAELRGRAPRRR